jgi:outer membrane protein insertion porin family
MRLSNSVGRTASRILIGVCATAGLLLFSTKILESQQSEPTQYVIERIDISGYRSIQISTIRAHILSRPGNLYNAEAVQRDADALRNAGYFSEVRLRVEDSPDRPNGKIVVFEVIEKLVIRRIQYRGIASITGADIRDALESNKIALSVGSRFDQTTLIRAATVIKRLLSEHGRPSATVTPTSERIASSNAMSIVFNIDEGHKTE